MTVVNDTPAAETEIETEIDTGVIDTVLHEIELKPNCKKLGLLDAGDGRRRKKLTEIDVIQFEGWADTTEEYTDLDAVAADRA